MTDSAVAFFSTVAQVNAAVLLAFFVAISRRWKGSVWAYRATVVASLAAPEAALTAALMVLSGLLTEDGSPLGASVPPSLNVGLLLLTGLGLLGLLVAALIQQRD